MAEEEEEEESCKGRKAFLVLLFFSPLSLCQPAMVVVRAHSVRGKRALFGGREARWHRGRQKPNYLYK